MQIISMIQFTDSLFCCIVSILIINLFLFHNNYFWSIFVLSVTFNYCLNILPLVCLFIICMFFLFRLLCLCIFIIQILFLLHFFWLAFCSIHVLMAIMFPLCPLMVIFYFPHIILILAMTSLPIHSFNCRMLKLDSC